MKLLINGNLYEASWEIINQCISVAKANNVGKNIIVALQHKDYVEMRKDEFKTAKALSLEIMRYKIKGIKVFYVGKDVGKTLEEGLK